MDETKDFEDGSAEKEEHSVSSDLIRGHINTIILRALYEGDKYGYEIIADIEEKSHGQYSLKQPSLYSALKRLEKDGCITSYWGGSVGGGRRKYFSLTEEGKAISERNQSEWEYSRTVIDSLISDKDFDFSNPAPNAVNMRILRDTTSRVPSRESGDDELSGYVPAFPEEERARIEREYAEKNEALQARLEELSSEAAALKEEKALSEADRARAEEIIREREWREQELAMRENALEAALRELERDKAASGNAMRLSSSQLQAKDAQIRMKEEELTRTTEQYAALKRKYEEDLEQERSRSAALIQSERADYRNLLERERDAREEEIGKAVEKALGEQEQNYALRLEQETTRITREKDEEFRRREQELLHRNYVELIRSSDAPKERDYDYYSPPVADSLPEAEPLEESTGDYRSVVRKIYDNSVRMNETRTAPTRATSLDGVDFSELEQRAAQDGIRITTSGGAKTEEAERSASVVHKGRALFLSAIVAFVYCVILGSVLLGMRSSISLPLFHPYFIWCAGLALLLVTGLAYANRFGERSVRRSAAIVLVNAFVIFVLLAIITLIVALSARIDFSSSDLAAFVIVPIVFFLIVPIFGVAYYLQVRPQKD